MTDNQNEISQTTDASVGKHRRRGMKWVSDTAYGRVLNVDFFLRHWLIVVCVIFMAIAYISSRYMVRDQKLTTRRLAKQLEIVDAEKANERESYMSNIRESSMTERIDTFHLGLSVRERPPYIVTEE